MKKKGFTLIELLAVIVILAIIALIIVPIVSNVIDSSRKAAFKESVNGMIDSTNNYISEYVLNHNDELNEFPVVFTCDGTSCKTSDNYTLTFKGNAPKSGNIIIQRDGVMAEYITDGKYCAYGYKWNLVVENSCGDVDVTKPTITGTQNGKVVTLTMTDNESGIDKYCVNNDDTTEGCSWVVPSNASSEEYEIAEVGTWYFFTKDKKGNISDSINFTTTSNDYCAFSIDGEAYTQETAGAYTFTVPNHCAGIYKLEVWGASGGYGGAGGYAQGNLTMSEGDTLYITVGGAGNTSTSGWASGGYNGGGGGNKGGQGAGGGGGGATHVATTLRGNGTLSNYNSYRSEVLIVAGGGGGGHSGFAGGGSGGGTSGSSGGSAGCGGGAGGTQTGGYSFGQGGSTSSNNSGGGGGGGWFGGQGGPQCNGYWGGGGGGGSAYIGGVEGGTTETGKKSGGGKITITYIGPITTVTFDANGGNLENNKKYLAGTIAIGEMPIPTKDGEYFFGWYFDQEFKELVTPDTVINANVTLYARWGTELTFDYTGKTAGIYISRNATFKLEVWGASGGYGGAGGYAYGNIDLNADSNLYIAVGGVGASSTNGWASGGFNGGGGGNKGGQGPGGGGGGATHIATTLRGNGTLTNYNSYRDEVLIVAGGGGGGHSGFAGGGSGGGLSGTNGGEAGCGGGNGATQTTGYAFGQGGSTSNNNSGGGGGAGWFGGQGGPQCNGYWGGGGGGGSSYIGGVTDGSTTAGQRSGNGMAKITLLSLN